MPHLSWCVHEKPKEAEPKSREKHVHVWKTWTIPVKRKNMSNTGHTIIYVVYYLSRIHYIMINDDL